MIRKRFHRQRSRAMADRAAQIARRQEVRRMLAELNSPFGQVSDRFMAADDSDYENQRLLH